MSAARSRFGASTRCCLLELQKLIKDPSPAEQGAITSLTEENYYPLEVSDSQVKPIKQYILRTVCLKLVELDLNYMGKSGKSLPETEYSLDYYYQENGETRFVIRSQKTTKIFFQAISKLEKKAENVDKVRRLMEEIRINHRQVTGEKGRNDFQRVTEAVKTIFPNSSVSSEITKFFNEVTSDE